MKSIRQVGLAGYLGVFAACDPSEGPSRMMVERADSAGIEIVRVLRATSDTVRLEKPLVRIGSPGASGPEHDVFQLISDLEALRDRRVAVVDNRGARVAVFDSAGSWLYDVGGRGEGPGEYTGPIYSSVRGDTLFLWDALQRRLSRYTAEGAFLGSVSIPHQTSAHPFAAIAEGFVMEVESGQLHDSAPARGALIRTRPDGTTNDTLVGPYPVPEHGWKLTDQATGSGHMVNPPAFAISPPWTMENESVVTLDLDAPAVEMRSLETGSLERIITLPYTPAPPTQSERDAYFGAIQADFGFSDEVIARERAQTEFVALRPPVAGILVDSEGRFWVAEHDPVARGRRYVGSGWDVIDQEQGRVVHMKFPEGFELKAVREGRAYGITTLDNGVHVIDVFDVGVGA